MPATRPYASIHMRSPLGPMKLTGTEKSLTALDFVDEKEGTPADTENSRRPPAVLTDAAAQLDDYFKGRRAVFTLPLAPAGTAFQVRVWQALQKVPYGRTVSYGDIARAIGHPNACRAVGGANNRNPISIVIPCHRIIGADGRLTGYGGGLWRKKWLLEHEQASSGARTAIL